MEKIKEFNFDDEKIKNWIKYQVEFKSEVEEIYKDLNRQFNLAFIFDKEEVINKIIEVNLDREAMDNWIYEKI